MLSGKSGNKRCHKFCLCLRLFTMKMSPTVELIVHHILQSLQPLQNGLSVHQVGNFAIPGSQPLIRNAPNLDELLGSVLDPAVHREQDNPHKHQNVDSQQSFDFACHSHERKILCGWLKSTPAAAQCGVAYFATLACIPGVCELGEEGRSARQSSWRSSFQHHGQLRGLLALL